MPQQQDAARDIESEVVKAISKTNPSIVAVSRVRKGSLGDPTARDFIPNQLSSGVVVDPKGLILTNYHVLGRVAENDYYIWARAKPDYRLRVYAGAAPLAADPWTDLAVLKIDADNLEPIPLVATNQPVQIGQISIVIGNPKWLLSSGESAAAWGIVSGTARQPVVPADRSTTGALFDSLHQYGTLLQFDARLNWETSGGALINLDGQLIGLTTALSTMQSFDTATGFAIPVDETFHRVLGDLRQGKTPEFGFLGISPRDLSSDQRAAGHTGVQVAEVISGTPAAAEIQFGDVITHINGEALEDADHLMRVLSSLGVSSEVNVKFIRDPFDETKSLNKTVVVRLTKRFIATRRPALQSQQRRSWRGIRVDFATAIDNIQARSHLIDPEGCVAIVSVERDSASWKSGLRPMWFISHVGKRRVATPDEFYSAIAEESGKVQITVTDSGSSQPMQFTVMEDSAADIRGK